MKKILALFLVILLVVAVAPAFAVVPMGPDPGIQEPGPLYGGSRVEFPLLDYLTAAPAYAESDSDSPGVSPPSTTWADKIGETPAMIAGFLFFCGIIYGINWLRKRKGKTTIEENIENGIDKIKDMTEKKRE